MNEYVVTQQSPVRQFANSPICCNNKPTKITGTLQFERTAFAFSLLLSSRNGGERDNEGVGTQNSDTGSERE